jgi:hypothetical protein
MFGFDPATLTQFFLIADNIEAVDVTPFTNLEQLIVIFGNLTGGVDLSNNNNLQIIRLGATNLPSIDVTNMPNLFLLRISNNFISTLDISNNPLLIDLQVATNQLNSTDIDNIIIQLDNNGLSNGQLEYQNNLGSPTIASCVAFTNLLAKGWTIIGGVNPCTGSSSSSNSSSSSSSSM